jgi:hypothetical protein
MKVRWEPSPSNFGYMLLEDDRVVGAYLAFYSRRLIDGSTEHFCNLAAWCVLPSSRLHSIRLLRALLAQEGYHFTDLSPSGNTIPVNLKMGFRVLPTKRCSVLNLPFYDLFSPVSVISARPHIRRLLDGDALRIFNDHEFAPAARHVLLKSAEAVCHVIFRKERLYQMPITATVIYVSNPQLFERAINVFCRYVLLHHRAVITHVEERIAKIASSCCSYQTSGRLRMYRSSSLGPAAVDYLYSELIALEW